MLLLNIGSKDFSIHRKWLHARVLMFQLSWLADHTGEYGFDALHADTSGWPSASVPTFTCMAETGSSMRSRNFKCRKTAAFCKYGSGGKGSSVKVSWRDNLCAVCSQAFIMLAPIVDSIAYHELLQISSQLLGLSFASYLKIAACPFSQFHSSIICSFGNFVTAMAASSNSFSAFQSPVVGWR